MTQDRAPDAEALLEHAGWLRALARRLVRGDEDDLVQDSWLAALQRPPRSDGRVGPWLGAVVRNLASNRRREAARRRDRERRSASEEASVPAPDELVQRSELYRLVVESIVALPEPVRGTMLLRWFEGLSISQIAERTSTPAATVRTRLHRGLSRLREALDHEHDGDRERWVMAMTPLSGARSVKLAVPPSVPTAPLFAMTTLKLLAAIVPAVLLFALLHYARSADQERIFDVGPTQLSELSSSSSEPPVGKNASEQIYSRRRVAALLDAKDQETRMAEYATPRSITVIDEVTGERALGYFVETVPIEPGVERETLITDREGRVTIPAGVDSIVPIDMWLDRQSVPKGYGSGRTPKPPALRVPPDGATLAVDAGCTVPLEIVRPPGVSLDDLFAELRTRTRHGGTIRGLARVRSFEGVDITRFPRRVANELQGVDLYVTSKDGLLADHVRAEDHVGKDLIAPLELRPFASVVVELTSSTNDEFSSPRVELRTVPNDSAHRSPSRRVRAHEAQFLEGTPQVARCSFLRLDPGRYELEVVVALRERVTRTLEIRASEVRCEKVVLRPAADLGPLEALDVTFSSTSGTFHRDFFVTAVVDEGKRIGDMTREHRVEWTETDGVWTGNLTIEALPRVRHVLRIDALRARYREVSAKHYFEDGVLEAVPGEPADFVLHDEWEFEPRSIRARDDESGEFIENFALSVTKSSRAEFLGRFRAFDGVVELPFLRDASDIALVVDSAEHLPGRLDAGCLTGEWSGPCTLEDGVLTIDLKRGWGCYIFASDEAGAQVAGVQILLDGVRVGATSASEALLVERASSPDKFEISAPGWRVLPAPFVDDEGTLVAGYRRSCSTYGIMLEKE